MCNRCFVCSQVRPVILAVITSALVGTPLIQLAPKLTAAFIDVLAHAGKLTENAELLDEIKVNAVPNVMCTRFCRSRTCFLQFIVRHLCSVCLPNAPFPVGPYSLFLFFINRLIAASPSLPVLQPSLAWLSIHVSLSPEAVAVLEKFVVQTGGDAVEATLSDSRTVPLNTAWTTPEDVLESAQTLAYFLSLVSPPWKPKALRTLQRAGEVTTGAAPAPYQSEALALPTSLVAIHEYLSRRLLRDSLTTALLLSVAVSPSGNPSPDQVLKKAVLGSSVDGAAPSLVSSFDVCDVGMYSYCVCARFLLYSAMMPFAGPLVGPLGLLNPSDSVRFTALACVDVVLAAHADTVVVASASASAGAGSSPAASPNELTSNAQRLVNGLWLTMHDSNEENAAYADSLWSRSDLELK